VYDTSQFFDVQTVCNCCQMNTHSFIFLPATMQMWKWHCNCLYACFTFRVVSTKKNFPCSSYHLILWPPETFLIEVKRRECEADCLSPVNLRSCYLSKEGDILTSVMYCIIQQWLLNFVPLNIGAICFGTGEVIAFCKGWH